MGKKRRKKGFQSSGSTSAKKEVIHADESDREEVSAEFLKEEVATDRKTRSSIELYIGGRLWRISQMQVFGLLVLIALLAFGWGLGNSFLNDDTSQIVSNPLVHSLSHLGQIFGSSGIKSSNPAAQAGYANLYYRPLMLSAFAFIYSFAGLSTFWYHLVQLLVYAACAFVVFLIFCYFFRPWLALVLALVFLLDPVNSQNVYYIANLQEPLYVFFGLLGLWIYMRYQDDGNSYLWLTVASLFLSLLAKESGIVFVGIVLLYAWLTNRKRCGTLALFMLAPVGIYVSLRAYAMGWHISRSDRPIDTLGLSARILTMPSVVWFYVLKTWWPWQLMAFYNWAYKSFSITGFLLPLLADIAVAIGIGRAGRYMANHRGQRDTILYWFFVLWFAIGLVINLQIIPLDETASDTWLIVSLIGFLGVVGTMVEAFSLDRFARKRIGVLAACALLLIGLGFRSAIRAGDWSNTTALAQSDVRQSDQDWVSDIVVANSLIDQGNYAQAYSLDHTAEGIYPNAYSEASLGRLYFIEGDYPQAQSMYMSSVKKLSSEIAIEQMSQLQVYYAVKPETGLDNIEIALEIYPKDGSVWASLALYAYKIQDYDYALNASKKAIKYQGMTQAMYNQIAAGEPVSIDVLGHPQTIQGPGGSSVYTHF